MKSLLNPLRKVQNLGHRIIDQYLAVRYNNNNMDDADLVKNLEGALKANINILLSSSMKLNNTNEGSNSLTGE